MKKNLYKLSDDEYDKLNPPSSFLTYRDDGMLFRSVPPYMNDWVYVGYIPKPRGRIAWFFYNLIHGIWMKYPLFKVLLFALDKDNNYGNSIGFEDHFAEGTKDSEWCDVCDHEFLSVADNSEVCVRCRMLRQETLD